MRKVGNITLDLEPLLDELVNHELQRGEILSLIDNYLTVHQPDCMEQYEDGSHPVYVYGHIDYINKYYGGT